MPDINTLIDTLKLEPHPEGGFYKEMYRSNIAINEFEDSRSKSALTSIYYLLEGKDFSAWHRIHSDETWYFHLGCDLLIYFFDHHQKLSSIQLGSASTNWQATIPANTWFAAKPISQDDFCLVSCAVAPGFEFDDFELAKRTDLLKNFGNSSESIEIIEMLTRA